MKKRIATERFKNEKDGIHESVLKEEMVDGLQIQNNEIVLDCTINGGGHSKEILSRFKVELIGLDEDSDALERARNNLGSKPKLVESNFRNLDKALRSLNIIRVNKVLFDLGLSSDQLSESGRGFSFKKDEPLLMTLNNSPSEEVLTAKDVLNRWGEDSLVSILNGFGEERYARKIARAIVTYREKEPIITTLQLVEIVKNAVPPSYRRGKINPATKTFQAIRIAVNDEFGALIEALDTAWEFLESNGRIAVITFHSLEDRLVKQWMKDKSNNELGKLITKKPIVPKREEIIRNPRSRSAKLRIIEKIY